MKYIFMLISVCLFSDLAAQNQLGFLNFYKAGPRLVNPVNVNNYADTALLVTGNLLQTGFPPQLMLMKTDTSGKVIWNTNLISTSYGVWSSAFPTANAIYTAGYNDSSTLSQAYISKYTHLGMPVWTKTVEILNNNSAYKIGELSNGDLIISGSTSDSLPISVRGYLLRMDTSGQVIWCNTYSDGTGKLVFNDMYIDSSDNIILTGNSDAPFFTKLDAGGNSIWQYKIVTGNLHYTVSNITPKNAGYMFAGTRRYLPDPARLLLFQTDTSGNILLSRTINTGNQSTDYASLNVERNSNGKYVMTYSEMTLKSGVGLIMDTYWVFSCRKLKFDWNLYYTFSRASSFRNNKAVFSGKYTYPGSATGFIYGMDLWHCNPECDEGLGTTVTDSFPTIITAPFSFTLQPGCISNYITPAVTYNLITDSLICGQITGIEEGNPDHDDFSVSPNPSNSYFEIEWNKSLTGTADLTLYSYSGQKVFSDIIPVNSDHYTLDGSRLPAGIYLLQVQSGNEWFFTKLVKM